MPDYTPASSRSLSWLLRLRPDLLAIWLGRALLSAHARSRQRRDLARLDARLLEDIDISPDQAREESGRAFWDAPGHWKL